MDNCCNRFLCVSVFSPSPEFESKSEIDINKSAMNSVVANSLQLLGGKGGGVPSSSGGVKYSESSSDVNSSSPSGTQYIGWSSTVE